MTVTKRQQLEFAAKHIEKWKSGYDYAVVEETTDGHLCVRWPSICTSGVTKKEWKQERDKMQKQSVQPAQQAQPAQDNSWHERGEFPPAGCECEMMDDRGGWVKCDVIAHKDSFCIAWVRSRMSPFYTNDWNEFRPCRTEREKAIDALIEIICAGGELSRYGSAAREIAERLYDAGMLK